MIRHFVVALTVAAPCAFSSPAANAQDYPYCIKGCQHGGGGGAGDCSFVSYQQCQATAAGQDAYCDVNPYFRGNEPQAGRPRLSHRRL